MVGILISEKEDTGFQEVRDRELQSLEPFSKTLQY